MRVLGEHGSTILGVTARGNRVVSASFHEHVVVWDLAKGKRLGNFGVPRGVVCWQGAMSPDGKTVAAGFGDCSVQLWDGKKQRQLAQLGGIVASVAWSADGKRLLTGNCGDNTVRLWDPKSGEQLASGTTKKSATWFVALSPDGKRALSGAGDKLVHVWEIENGRELAALSGHSGKILSLNISSDGKRAVSASQDRTARLWDLQKLKPLAVLAGHKKQVSCAVFSPDGGQVATVSSDRTLRIWETRSGEELRCEKLEDAPSSVAWSNEIVVAAGKRLLVF